LQVCIAQISVTCIGTHQGSLQNNIQGEFFLGALFGKSLKV